MILYRWNNDGALVVDTVTKRSAYAYPTSPLHTLGRRLKPLQPTLALEMIEQANAFRINGSSPVGASILEQDERHLMELSRAHTDGAADVGAIHE